MRLVMWQKLLENVRHSVNSPTSVANSTQVAAVLKADLAQFSPGRTTSAAPDVSTQIASPPSKPSVASKQTKPTPKSKANAVAATTQESHSKAAKKDPNRPKAPKSAFLRFRDQHLERVRQELGDETTSREEFKEISKLWKTLADEERKVYQYAENRDKEKYAAVIAIYDAQHQNDDDDSDDSDVSAAPVPLTVSGPTQLPVPSKTSPMPSKNSTISPAKAGSTTVSPEKSAQKPSKAHIQTPSQAQEGQSYWATPSAPASRAIEPLSSSQPQSADPESLSQSKKKKKHRDGDTQERSQHKKAKKTKHVASDDV